MTGTTAPNQSGPGSNGSEGVLHISQRSRTGASLVVGLVSRTLVVGESYHDAEVPSVYFRVPAEWEIDR